MPGATGAGLIASESNPKILGIFLLQYFSVPYIGVIITQVI